MAAFQALFVKHKLLKGNRLAVSVVRGVLEILSQLDYVTANEVNEVAHKELRELSYEMEDKLDDWVLLAFHQVYYKDGIKRHVSKFEKLRPAKIHYQTAKEVDYILGRLVDIGAWQIMDKIVGGCSIPRIKKVDPHNLVGVDASELKSSAISRLGMIHKDASELVGVNGPRKDLVRWLSNKEGESAHQQKVVSILGCAGLGKTALAKQIYDEFGETFQYRAFVSVSESPDMAEILSSILSQLDIRDYNEIEDPSQIISQIGEFLRDKRYFIIIDDIWDIDSWNTLEPALCKNSRGSIIMTTTRRSDVAKQCCPSKGNLVYKIQPLSVADSKMLFFKKIFGCEEHCPPDLKEATDDILEKCEGLPLAINAISSLLSAGPTEERWDRLRSSFYFAPGENTYIDDMYYILSRSYSELPYRLRDCLMYFTIFPEGYHVERDRLVHRWISEGPIPCSHKSGEQCLHELIERSLIESVGMQYDGKARFYRVHNVIRNFLISRSLEENFCTGGEGQNNRVRRLSLVEGEDTVRVEQLDLSHVRSLAVFGHAEQLPSLMNSYALRLLDLQDCSELGNHHVKDIGIHYKLRYLNISGTDISELPIQTGGLQYLQTLDASFTELVELPGSITRQDELVRLFVSDETKLPDDIGKMNLQELGDINTFKQSLNFLKELGKLTKLGKLSIIWDTNGISKFDKESYKEKKLVSSLCKLDASNLRKISITFYLRDKDGFIGDPFLPALNSIQEVFLRHGRICWIGKWMVSLANLEKLYVSSREEIDKQDLHMIGSIQPLLEFRLYSGFLGPITISGGFQKLERLELKFSFSQLKFEAGAMPNLKKLDLHIYLSKFKSACVGFDFGIQHLSSLVWVSIIIFCEGVSAAYVEAAEGAFKKMASEHPNLPTLKMIRESTEFMTQDE